MIPFDLALIAIASGSDVLSVSRGPGRGSHRIDHFANQFGQQSSPRLVATGGRLS